MRLLDKTLVVTGVLSGIGADVARLASFHDAKVIGIDRNEPSLSLDGFIQVDLSDTHIPVDGGLESTYL